MRGVPDVAGDADPNTGVTVICGGQAQVFGGTSGVAPLWASLKGLIDGTVGRKTAFTPMMLYSLNALTDITSGSNGAWTAGKGWDPCTGLGTPNASFVQAVIQQFTSSVASPVRP
jgi:kumamolisin